MTAPQRRERLLELLADEATVGLEPAEALELDRLRGEFPDIDPEPFADIATLSALALGLSAPSPAGLPASLRSALIADAALDKTSVTPRPRTRRWAIAGWAVAASLAGALAWTLTREAKIDPIPQQQIAERVEPSTLAERLARAGDALTYRAETAEIVWSPSLQTGTLNLKDLPPSVPGESQYQLWIVDSGRKEPLPVDGGVFDLPAAGGTVTIRPTLPVFQALAFAVTREAPGGVVVSRNPHLVVLMR